MPPAQEWGDVAGAGLKIWRIENLKPVAVAADTHGQFHVGDAYILLHTSADLKRRALHYWLGAECSQDEAGACAYKVCELDALTARHPQTRQPTQDTAADQQKSS